MILPTPEQYLQAVQHPNLAFSDQRLASGRAHAGLWGLPEVQTGNFAAVFRIDSHNARWAVRCFLKDPHAKARQRFTEVAGFLAQQTSQAFVAIEYLPEGIKVASQRLPIVLMPWVDGTPVNDWVGGRVRRANEIAALRGEFTRLIRQLGDSGAAHGDLQHGNILVAPDGTLRLLDYDGMYLPSFAGWGMPELGHSNYQHPLRGTHGEYGPRLDRFAAIVIWTALRAVEIDPALWDRYDNGDNLLFTAKDLAKPEHSALLRDLSALDELSKPASDLSRLLLAQPDAVPTLEEFISGNVAIASSVATVRVGPLAAYPIVDLRRAEITQPLGTRVIAVGEVQGLHSGTTRRGDPYRFIRFGARGGSSLKAVLWSEVLARSGQAGLPRNGDLIAVTGVLSSYGEQRQIVLERFAALERLDARRVVELLGTSWGDSPPVDDLRADLHPGDVVEHQVFGQGIVVDAQGDIASIQFHGEVRRIHTGVFPMRVVSHASYSSPAASAEVIGRPHARAQGSKASRLADNVMSKTDVDALRRLWGRSPVPGKKSRGRTSPAVTSVSATASAGSAPRSQGTPPKAGAFGMFDLLEPAPPQSTNASNQSTAPMPRTPSSKRRLDWRVPIVIAVLAVAVIVMIVIGGGTTP